MLTSIRVELARRRAVAGETPLPYWCFLKVVESLGEAATICSSTVRRSRPVACIVGLT
jgi:hypothetical protein